MSAPIIQQAISMGYNAKQILGFLSSKIPGLKKGIKKAQESGYPEQMILQFLSNQIPSKNTKAAQEQLTDQQQYLKNVGIKTKQERDEDRNQFIKTAAQVGLAGVSAYKLGTSLGLLGRSGSAAQPSSIMPALTGQKQLGMPSPGPKVETQTMQQPQAAPPAGQGTSQTPGPLTPQVPRAPNPKHPDLIKQMGLETVIEGLKGKENPQTIAQVLEQHFINPAQKKWLQTQTSDPLENIVGDYLSSKEQPPNESLETGSNLVEEEPVKNTVLTPNGDIGSIESEEKGVASVDVDGKKKKFRDQDIIKSPIPEKDMGELYEELINKIPESERSAVINVAGYDPNHNELIFMPHTGALYVYKDIPPEFAEKLKGAMFKAKTTGENLYGAWAEGESSRFAGLYQLIKELQKIYGGKGKEYVRKYEKVYDFLAIPKSELKEKERKKREEERKRKKPRLS